MPPNTEVLRRKQDQERLRELIDWLEELRDLDAEHARRRTVAKGREGEAT